MKGNDEAIISLATLAFLVLTTGLGLIIRITNRWSKIEANLTAIADKITLVLDQQTADRLDLNHRIEKVDSRLERHETWHSTHAD